ncbi:MAG TPA: nuclear transport factor 2 family protein [Bradyrhizobium sp.]|nr:nuclear transport factor 2 family protein [Bradyrhizobium sp.]
MNTPTDIVRGFYNALGHGDVPGVLALLCDDLEWTEAERFPYYSGTWRSPQEVLDKLLVPLMRDWRDFSATAHDFVAEGDRVVSLGVYSGTAKATDKSMTAPFAHVWTVRDGRITKFGMYTDTAKVLEALAPHSSEDKPASAFRSDASR